MTRRVDYDEHQHTVYAKGRTITVEAMRVWMDTFAAYAPGPNPLTVLDLGAGIGRFTPTLAHTFGGTVYGVEPSARMREIAVRDATHPQVSYVEGSAERIPLPDDTCDLALMYLVLHHVRDRPAAAAEIARVLRPGGRLLVRSTFPDRPPTLLWHHYFPAAVDVERELFPTTGEVLDVFGEAGFEQVGFTQVRVRMDASLADFAERLKLRAISVFESLTEEQIESGFASLDADVAAGRHPGPVDSDVDLLVLGLPD